MEKNIFCVLILMSLGLFTRAQSSSFYDSIGRLRADTTYKVDVDLLDNLTVYEDQNVFQRIYKDIIYPEKCYENGISGLVIAKISITKKDLNIACTIVKSPDMALDRLVIDAVYKNSLSLFKSTTLDSKIVFFVPFLFELESKNFKTEIRKNGLIKIQKTYYKGRQSF